MYFPIFYYLQASEFTPAFLADDFLQSLVFITKRLIFLPEPENFFLKEIDPSFHCFVQDASAGIDGSGLLFHGPVNLSPHDGILIREIPLEAPVIFTSCGTDTRLSLIQQFADRPFRRGISFHRFVPGSFQSSCRICSYSRTKHLVDDHASRQSGHPAL